MAYYLIASKSSCNPLTTLYYWPFLLAVPASQAGRTPHSCRTAYSSVGSILFAMFRCSTTYIWLLVVSLYIQCCCCSSEDFQRRQAVSDNSTMDQISSFIDSLGVSSDTASTLNSTLTSNQDLTSFLETNSTNATKRSLPELTPLACLTAQIVLGSNIVSTDSSNASVVEVNW